MESEVPANQSTSMKISIEKPLFVQMKDKYWPLFIIILTVERHPILSAGCKILV
jgi:hypothetical protein